MALDAVASMHALLVHFPIGLLLLAVVSEFVRFRRDEVQARSTTRFLLYSGAVGAILAAIAGWLKADAGAAAYDESDLSWHRWSGVAVSVLASVLVILAARSGANVGTKIAFKVFLIVMAVAVIVAGHFGAGIAGHPFELMEILRGMRHR